MSNIPKEIETKIEAYMDLVIKWERAGSEYRRDLMPNFPPAYEELKTAIAEAIQRGPLEHAEPDETIREGYAQAVIDRDEFARIYDDECTTSANLRRELGEARAEITRLEETLASADGEALQQVQERLGEMEGDRDEARARLEICRDGAKRIAERLTITRGWLEVFEQGYLTPEGISVGTRNAIKTLAEIAAEIRG